eukprot:NODE_5390_length_1020_cov_62.470457_g4821_i0.p1 GENE.NODE_5390_length_1020_cov_62.470457_g4821_i0~~NODE_5390_length_1020_cov_62.470457_g4821_i0.p1  ORF type:complete len:276 (+),score=41.38 NODE_5390_length_1020_cov_62.470457_g4821_i0:56-829(+)
MIRKLALSTLLTSSRRSLYTANDVASLYSSLKESKPEQIIKKALETFGKDIAISFSGAEDVLLIEYAAESGLPFRVFSLDTGRLHPETYKYFEDVEKYYKIRIEYMFPQAETVQKLVREKGMFSFYEDGHSECCNIRKVEPLKRQLGTLKAWITGQRKDQSQTRVDLPVVQVDPVFKGVQDLLVKFNPMSEVKSDEVWNTIIERGIPYNNLHAKGFTSIGCEPCTRPILPTQHEREGRWWWEDTKKKECGLHAKHKH